MNLNFVSGNWWVVLLVAVVLAVSRYVLFAGTAYLFCYKAGIRALNRFKIQPAQPKARQVQRELLYSLATVAVFSFIGVSIFWLYKKGLTTLYTDVDQYGWPYFFFSILLMIVLHDTYFYWTHRLLHTPWFMKHVHVVHHRSVNPTPLAAYAFHPLEAILEGSFAYALVTVFPVHVAAFFSQTLFVLVMNVLGHSGFEFFPRRLRAGKVGSLFTSSTHHNLHHSKVHHNFGYYFTFWDRLMRTLHKDTFN